MLAICHPSVPTVTEQTCRWTLGCKTHSFWLTLAGSRSQKQSPWHEATESCHLSLTAASSCRRQGCGSPLRTELFRSPPGARPWSHRSTYSCLQGSLASCMTHVTHLPECNVLPQNLAYSSGLLGFHSHKSYSSPKKCSEEAPKDSNNKMGLEGGHLALWLRCYLLGMPTSNIRTPGLSPSSIPSDSCCCCCTHWGAQARGALIPPWKTCTKYWILSLTWPSPSGGGRWGMTQQMQDFSTFASVSCISLPFR